MDLEDARLEIVSEFAMLSDASFKETLHFDAIVQNALGIEGDGTPPEFLVDMFILNGKGF